MIYFKKINDASLPEKERGFSLIEMAISLLILGLVMGSFYGLAKLLFETDHKQTELANMQTIQRSISTYLAVNVHLPCPDTDNDGKENRADGISCDKREGYLPYSDLGVKSKDAWGNEYYYRVNENAESPTYITEICQSASVVGKSGPEDSGLSGLLFCPKTNVYYCDVTCSYVPCSDVCDVPWSDTIIDPRPNINTNVTPNLREAPFFHLVTPPSGSNSGEGNLIINDENGDPMGGGIVAVVLSWGANGKEVYRYNSDRENCGAGTEAENINCTNSRDFVDIRSGLNRDFMTWVTVSQAKVAIIGRGDFK